MKDGRNTGKQPHSLRRVVLAHNAAFLLLMAVTSAQGVYGWWFWQITSKETLLFNTTLSNALEIRGDIFREIKAITTAKLANDEYALERYWQHLYRIDQRFYRLKDLLNDDKGAAAVTTMRQSYELMQSEMNKLLAADTATGYRGIRKLADDVYQQRMLGDFENAFTLLRKVIEERRATIEQKLDYWTRLAPVTVSAPLVIALGLLLYSRHVFRHQFITPMDDLAAGALEISAGNLQRYLPVRGVQEVASLTQSINDMARQLSDSQDTLVQQERQAALGTLVPVVAHNIRNPLASIRATAQVVGYANTKAERAEAAQAITQTVDRLERWVSALLLYLNPLQPRTEVTALSSITSQTLQALDTRLKEKRLQIVRSDSSPVIRLKADSALLEQALYGLVNNAVEASAPGGEIGIHVESRDNKAVLTIDDDGPGMPFEPKPTDLSPGPSTKRFGTGLGIPFAYKIVTAHAGNIHYETAPTGGTRVRLELPAMEI